MQNKNISTCCCKGSNKYSRAKPSLGRVWNGTELQYHGELSRISRQYDCSWLRAFAKPRPANRATWRLRLCTPGSGVKLLS